jgi:hypothetical protein
MDWQRIINEIDAGYDMPGYIDRYGDPDATGHSGHFTDEFKLPNHITFSTDSKYHSPKTPGGKWEKITENGKDQWHYTPSQFVIDQQGADRLKWYFNNREPDSILHLPEEIKQQSYDIGNPNPGSSQPYLHQYPTAMNDSGQYLMSDRVPLSNVMEFQPDERTLYNIMQTKGFSRNYEEI